MQVVYGLGAQLKKKKNATVRIDMPPSAPVRIRLMQFDALFLPASANVIIEYPFKYFTQTVTVLLSAECTKNKPFFTF